MVQVSVFLAIICAVPTFGTDELVRNTKYGKVRGILSAEGQSYLGIPYGKAERFSQSVSVQPWTDIKSAEQYGPQCTQPLVFCQSAPSSCNTEMSEDCLTLNVYTPPRAKSKARGHKYSVLVWIHGGFYQAYTAGSPYFNGLALASAARIIVVTFNYRLGALGFLKIPGVETTGNYGFYDQRLALQWVQDNIHYFGGNPNEVTVGGESAGAHATLYHMMTAGSKCLFQRAIALSPPGVEVPTAAVASKTADYLLKNLDCDTSENKLSCLRGKTAGDIATQSILLPAPDNFLHRVMRYGIYIDGLEITEGFYDQSNRDRKFGDKPMIIGTAAFDALRFVYRLLLQPVPLTYFSAVFGQWRPAITMKTQDVYLTSPVSASDIRPEISEVLTDAIFTCPARFFADRLAKQNNVWIYVFNQPNLDTYTSPVSCEDRSCHVDDIPYLFRHPDEVTGAKDSYFRQLSDLMVSYIGSFVRTANPNSRRISPKWIKYNTNTYCTIEEQEGWVPSCKHPFLELRYPDPRIVRDFRDDRCDFWDSVGYKQE